MSKPPIAARKYMKEFDETEAEFREWFDRQRKAYYGQPDNSGGSFTWWVALKMGCTTSQADKVIEWMEAP